MRKILSLDEAKNKVKKTNLIIYGSIRNIEEHFAKSFSNIDTPGTMFCNIFGGNCDMEKLCNKLLDKEKTG